MSLKDYMALTLEKMSNDSLVHRVVVYRYDRPLVMEHCHCLLNVRHFENSKNILRRMNEYQPYSFSTIFWNPGDQPIRVKPRAITARCWGISDRPPLYALAEENGRVLQYTDMMRRADIAIMTDEDVCSLAFADFREDSVLQNVGSVLVTCHSTGTIRLWSCTDGVLLKEMQVGQPVVSIHAIGREVSNTALVELESRECIIYDLWGSKRLHSLVGHSKAQPIRDLKVDAQAGHIVVVDGYGQVFLYTQTGSVIFSEKRFNEGFHASIGAGHLALVCPMKVILYRTDTSGSFVPMTSVLSEDASVPFFGACILSCRRIIAWTGRGYLDLLQEEPILCKNYAKCVSVIRTSDSSMLASTSDGVKEYFFLKNQAVHVPARIRGKAFDPSFEFATLASDGLHYFLVSISHNDSQVHVHPLSIPNCSFELDLPPPAVCGKVSCLSGTVITGRIFGGFANGYLCSWVVGTSQVERRINLHTFSAAAINITNVIGEDQWIAVLDESGCVTVVEREKIIIKFQINFIINLIISGNNYRISKSGEDEISCTISYLHSEKWNISKKYFSESAFVAEPVSTVHRVTSVQSLTESRESKVSVFFGGVLGRRSSDSSKICTSACPTEWEAESRDVAKLVPNLNICCVKNWSCENQNIATHIFNNWKDRSLAEMTANIYSDKNGLDRFYSHGIIRRSKFTNSFQAGYVLGSVMNSKASAVANTLTALRDRLLGNPQGLPNSRTTNDSHTSLKRVNYSVDLLLDLLRTLRIANSQEFTDSEGKPVNLPSPLLRLSREEIEHDWAIIDMIIEEVSQGYRTEGETYLNRVMELFREDSERYLPLVLVASSIAPHEIRGYREALAELNLIGDGEKTALENLSESAKMWIEITEKVLNVLYQNRGFVILRLFSDVFTFLRKFVINKQMFNEIFVILFANVVDVTNQTVIPVVDDESQQGSVEVSKVSAPMNFTAEKVSQLSVSALLAIGFKNPSKFVRRISTLIKTTHTSEVPIFLITQYIQTFAQHSIMHLPMLFEIVVLPCLDPMDYRIRRNSIGPATNLFRVLNRRFPMTSFHQGKQKFAIGSTQGQVIVFDIRSATKWRILDGHTGAISAVGFDQTGKYLCSYSATDCTVRVWHITGGGVTGVSGPTVIHGNSAGPTSILGGLLGSTGGKCVQVKQLGTIDEDKAVNGIKHPFNMVYRINGVKIRWTSENDILLVRENGQGIQIRL